jgi:multidrug resistance efflux pump
MLELIACSLITVFPDYLYRRYVQGMRIGKEITIFSVWYVLRWGITACVMLTVAIIATVFFFHPSSTNVMSFFRTVPIISEATGRVAEVYLGHRDKVAAGDPIFRLDSSSQEAAVAVAQRKIAEVDAAMVVARTDLLTAEGKIAEAQAALQQVEDDLRTKRALNRGGSNVVATREIEKLEVDLGRTNGALKAANAAREAAEARLDALLPSQKASAQAALEQAETDLRKTVVRAGFAGRVEQFTMRVGDIVSPIMRPGGILIPEEAGRQALQAGFDQVSASVIKVGMIGEVACNTLPWRVIPVVVAAKQDYIAAGQFRGGEQLTDFTNAGGQGSVLVHLEPLYEGGIDEVTPGSNCMANLYSNHHDEIAAEGTSTARRIGLHVVDALGLVHAMLLRVQVVVMPVKTLVLSGH